MRLSEELCQRIAWHYRTQKEAAGSPMSAGAFAELSLAVQDDPKAFISDPADQALMMVYEALLADDTARSEDEFLDDASYEEARAKRYQKLSETCTAALEIHECLDARVVIALTSSLESYEVRKALEGAIEAVCTDIESYEDTKSCIERQLEGLSPELKKLMMRPYLRAFAALARTNIECASYANARTLGEQLIELDPDDELGARFTLAIALARLEDEDAFNALDTQFSHQGNAWMHLCRTLLMFKLDRIDAAKRALRGFASLCAGGSYALLRPIFVETYIPQRPLFETGSFEEAVLAVHECDPTIMDTPDFLPWAAAQGDFTEQAQRFARNNDLDW